VCSMVVSVYNYKRQAALICSIQFLWVDARTVFVGRPWSTRCNVHGVERSQLMTFKVGHKVTKTCALLNRLLV
jgi:hypothetical protein